VYGALLMVFVPALPKRRARRFIVAVAVLVALIGFTRLALGVHSSPTCSCAWALGVAWLGVTAYATELSRIEEGLRPTRPLTEGLEPEAAKDLKPTRPTGTGPSYTPGGRWPVPWWRGYWSFGALYALGTPLAHYHKGNGNILGDSTIPHWLAAHRTSLLDKVSFLGGEAGNTHLILASGCRRCGDAGRHRQWRPIVFLLATMLGELTLFLASAAIVGRARPDVSHLDGQLPTSSFPSATSPRRSASTRRSPSSSCRRTRAWWRWLLVVAAVLMPLWVTWSRMYRGMHHPTDVIGALLLAAGWLPRWSTWSARTAT